MTSNQLTKHQIRELHKLNNIAIKLDEGIQAEEISNDIVDKAQDVLNKVSEQFEYEAIKEQSLKETYIIYEVQALILWIQDNEKEAMEFINIAKDIKGDDNLYTRTAREILSYNGGQKMSKNSISKGNKQDLIMRSLFINRILIIGTVIIFLAISGYFFYRISVIDSREINMCYQVMSPGFISSRYDGDCYALRH